VTIYTWLSAIKSITSGWTVTIDWVELMHCFHIAAIWCCARNTSCLETKSSQLWDAITLTYLINFDHFGRSASEKVTLSKQSKDALFPTTSQNSWKLIHVCLNYITPNVWTFLTHSVVLHIVLVMLYWNYKAYFVWYCVLRRYTGEFCETKISYFCDPRWV